VIGSAVMRALAIDRPGVAAVVERPVPEAGVGEVLVRVARVGLCGTDLSTYLGKNPLVSYPRVIGHEIAGRIECAGPEVPASWAQGTPVAISPYKNCGACAACRASRPNACRNNQTLGVQREGALAEFVVAPASRLHTSRSLDLDRLALVEPFSVGMHAVARARVTASDTVLVIGCGGVGAGAVAGAAGRGARVIAMDLDAGKRALARHLGAADEVSGDGDDPLGELLGLTGGEGPEVVIEAVGSPATYRLALEAVAACGRIACIGWVKGDVALEARHIVAKEVDLLGSRNAMGEFDEVIALFESGRVDPLRLITKRLGLEQVPDVFREWAARPSEMGKVLVALD
jgi:threonine dehydrogenase-like Zn-dependent dehydrogenase